MSQQQQQPPENNNNNIIIIPTDVIVHHIAPFVNDRTTFDNLCCYTNRSILNGMQNSSGSTIIQPPWPDRVTLQSNSDIGRTFPTSISMAINNTMLVCGGLNGQVHLWDSHLKKNKKKKQPPPPTSSSEESSSSLPSLVSKSSSSSTMILKTNKKEGRITAVAISPDGNKLVCGGIRYVYLWKNKQRKTTTPTTKTSIMEDNNSSSSPSTSFQFQDPPQRLGRWMPIIERFNRQAMREHRYRTSLLLDFSSDSKYIISSRRFHIADRHEELYTIKIWNSNNDDDDGLCLATLLGLDTTTTQQQQQQQQQQNTNNTDAVVDGGSSCNMVFSAIFSPVHPNQFACVQAGPGIFRDKHAILICDVDKEIEIYNNNVTAASTAATTTTCSTYIRTRMKTDSQISSLSFSPSGKYLVSCSFNGSIHVWDNTSQQCIKVIEGTTASSSKHINKTRSLSPRLLVRVAVTFISPVDFVTAQNDTIQQWTIGAADNTINIKNNLTSQQENNKENNGSDLHNNNNGGGGETNATTTTTAASSSSSPPTTTSRTTTTIPKQNHQKKKKNQYSTNTTRFSSWKSLFQTKGRKQQQQQQQHSNNKNYYYYSGYNNDFASSTFFCRHNSNVTMTVASRNQQILASRDKSGEIRIVQIQSLH